MQLAAAEQSGADADAAAWTSMCRRRVYANPAKVQRRASPHWWGGRLRPRNLVLDNANINTHIDSCAQSHVFRVSHDIFICYSTQSF